MSPENKGLTTGRASGRAGGSSTIRAVGCAGFSVPDLTVSNCRPQGEVPAGRFSALKYGP